MRRRAKLPQGGAIIEAWFDGVCEPRNPGGHAAWGALVKINGETKYEEGGYVGVGPAMSNNVAEYSGCLAALKWIHQNAPAGIITICGDSKLVINQLAGRWKVNGGHYYPYFLEADTLLNTMMGRWQRNINFAWIPRDQNAECDRLSKQQLHDRGVTFRIQPEEAPTHGEAQGQGR